VPDHRLKALTALGKRVPSTDAIGDLVIAEQPDIALASVERRRGGEATFSKAAEKLMGRKLPEVGQSFAADPVGAFWIGPGQWMLEAPHESHEHLDEIAAKALGATASVTEQSDAWVRFDIEGGTVLRLFERLTSLDLRKVPAGGASRSIIEHIGCFIVRRAEARFSVYGARSYAASLHHALVEAARSIA
jgi:sarcosine oxidase subunit gamma